MNKEVYRDNCDIGLFVDGFIFYSQVSKQEIHSDCKKHKKGVNCEHQLVYLKRIVLLQSIDELVLFQNREHRNHTCSKGKQTLEPVAHYDKFILYDKGPVFKTVYNLIIRRFSNANEKVNPEQHNEVQT